MLPAPVERSAEHGSTWRQFRALPTWARWFGDSALIGSVTDGALLDHKTALLRVFELVSRVFITTALFSHLLLQTTEASWRLDRGFTDPEAFRRHEQQMAQVERALRATGDRVG